MNEKLLNSNNRKNLSLLVSSGILLLLTYYFYTKFYTYRFSHRNKPVLAYKEPKIQENGVNKFCTLSSLKSHL